MRILILGGDGYLGWPTAMYLSRKGNVVGVVDNFNKRRWELEVGAVPLIRIFTLHERVKKWKEITGRTINVYVRDLTSLRGVDYVLREFIPDVIIHFGEQPSAPYSMLGAKQAADTQYNNIIGTINVLFSMRKYCRDAHLIKLGTMGEYGTPNIDIEEGYIDIVHNGRKDRMLYPKSPGSYYHLSKVHDTNNIYFSCNNWGLRATDLNQGIVYGVDTEDTVIDDSLVTSFHYDEVFGTVLNRFCVQAVSGNPITPYGSGKQLRGFLNIVDTLKCIEIASNNPPEKGVLEIYNQFTEVFSINQLASMVHAAASELGMSPTIEHIGNPRNESEDHYYNPKHTKLIDLGLSPNKLSDVLINSMLNRIYEYREYINSDVLRMGVKWKI